MRKATTNAVAVNEKNFPLPTLKHEFMSRRAKNINESSFDPSFDLPGNRFEPICLDEDCVCMFARRDFNAHGSSFS